MTNHSTSKASHLTLVLGLCAFIVGWDSMVVAPITPTMMDDLNASNHIGSLLVSSYALTYFLFSPLLGALSDRVGRKTILVSGLTIFSIGTLLTGLATSWWPTIAMRCIAGIGGGAIMPSIFSLIGDNTPPESRGKAIGNVMAMLLASTVIGVPLGTYLSDITSWRWTFGIIAATGLTATIASITTVPHANPPHDNTSSPAKTVAGMFKTAFQTPVLLTTLGATFCWNAGLQTIFASIGSFYSLQLGLHEREIALVILGAGIASVAGSVFGGRSIRRIGIKLLMPLTASGAALSVLTLVLGTPHTTPVVLAHILWSFCIGAGQPALTTLASELKPSIRGTAIALNGSTQYAAMFFASITGGILAKSTGNYLLPGILSAVFSACTMIAIHTTLRRASSFQED